MKDFKIPSEYYLEIVISGSKRERESERKCMPFPSASNHSDFIRGQLTLRPMHVPLSDFSTTWLLSLGIYKIYVELRLLVPGLYCEVNSAFQFILTRKFLHLYKKGFISSAIKCGL